MLEDESGRLRLTGAMLTPHLLVTGCIIAVMGTENADGDFEVLDLKIADLPPQPQRRDSAAAAAAASPATSGTKGVASNTEANGRQENSSSNSSGHKIAIVSGLEMSGDAGSMLMLDLLSEYLLGEAGGTDAQKSSAKISRLIIAGDSLAHASPLGLGRDEVASSGPRKTARKYGYDSNTYNAGPVDALDAFLVGLLPSLPITLIPGAADPANVTIPQQPLHLALFPSARAYAASPVAEGTAGDGGERHGWFDSVTNPWQGDVDGWRMLGTGGQTVEDVSKYVLADDRLDLMDCLLRWRHLSPTAPDTLCEFCFSYSLTSATGQKTVGGW